MCVSVPSLLLCVSPDLNGDEVISISEFKEGILSLQHILHVSYTEADVDQLIYHIDTDGDRQLSYSEFFASFQINDPLMQEVQKKSAAAKASLNKSGSGIPPSANTSPAVSPRALAEARRLHE